MPSGPVAAAIVLALAVLLGGIYLFAELRHHGGARARERARGGERLPLFGTDGLVDLSTPAASRSVPLPATPRGEDGRRTPPMPAPAASAERAPFAPP
ncbi:MAG: hypothetical protein ACXWZ7_15545, partial [Gemmatirosa sp.]